MNDGLPKYLVQLEKLWEHNKAAAERSTAEDELRRRPKGLRAPDLMYELLRLSVLWKDPRFEACAHALMEHGIVEGNLSDRSLRFTGRDGHAFDDLKQKREASRRKVDDLQVACVRQLVSLYKSEFRACAEIAAAVGRPANSFAAAVEQLRHLVQKSGKRVRTQKSRTK
jgi:hypothetical protein